MLCIIHKATDCEACRLATVVHNKLHGNHSSFRKQKEKICTVLENDTVWLLYLNTIDFSAYLKASVTHTSPKFRLLEFHLSSASFTEHLKYSYKCFAFFKRVIIHKHHITLNFNEVSLFETQIIETYIGIIVKHLSSDLNYALANCWHIRSLNRELQEWHIFVDQNPEIIILAFLVPSSWLSLEIRSLVNKSSIYFQFIL